MAGNPMDGAMRVWRITRKRHAATAFSGEGARLYAARWNPAGVPVVYTSTSLALAAMETFVHLEPRTMPEDLVFIEAELPVRATDCERVQVAKLPKDWRRVHHPRLEKLGAEWAQSGRSLVLLVPSAAVEEEWNALINPLHPDASRIVILETKPFHFDERMFKG